MNFPYDLHALGDMSKRREALAIGISLPAEIQFGLIADAD